MKSIFKTFFLSLCIIANTSLAYAQTGSILPPAKTTFVDQNGKPLTSGTVDFYIPSTTTRKTTWQDAAETIPNTNPVVLDGAGRALILGSGSYRQIVKDRLGNLIWDQVTSSTGSGSSGPTATGDGDLVGTIKPWAGLTAPNQYMFTYGQEVSRTTYAALYTAITSSQSVFCNSGSPILSGLGDTTNFPIGAKVEISCVASGNSTILSKTTSTITLAANANVTTNAAAIIYPWGNGNGTTTFNLPDFRGFVIAGNNNMGGVASSILTTTYFGSANPNSVGAAGGSQSHVVLLAEIPTGITSTGSNLVTVISTPTNIVQGIVNSSSNGVAAAVQTLSGATATAITSTGTNSTSVTSTNTGGSQLSLIQPTKTSNYIIKITPDSNSATASGVTSLGGMTGSIACGANITCTGNTISANTTVVPPSLGGVECKSIEFYGGAGDNSTDNSPAFTAFKTANASIAKSCLTFGAGLYRFSTSISWTLNSDQSVTFIGAGHEVTNLVFTGAGNGLDFTYFGPSPVQAFTGSAFSASGMTLQTTSIVTGSAIKITGNTIAGDPSRQTVFNDIVVRGDQNINSWNIGFEFQGASGIFLTNSVSYGCTTGACATQGTSIYFASVGGVTATGLNVTNFTAAYGQYCIRAEGSFQGILNEQVNCTAFVNGFIFNGSGGCQCNIINSQAAATSQAVVLNNAGGSQIIGNAFILLANNTLAIGLEGGSSDAVISGNTITAGITGVSQIGVLVQSGSTNNVINNNIFTNVTGTGILLQSGANNNYALLNKFDGSSGLTDSGTGNNAVININTLNGNTITSGTGTLTLNAQTLNINNGMILATSGTNPSIQFQGSDTYVGRATTDTLTNKTLVAPVLGTPASGNLANTTAFPAANLGGLGTGVATALAATSTGAGGIVRGTSGSPTIASGACGTGTNGAISGTNISGIVTIGAVATTTCTISFSGTITAPNACIIAPGNATAAATGTTLARVGTPGTTNWVITGSALASTVYSYICL